MNDFLRQEAPASWPCPKCGALLDHRGEYVSCPQCRSIPLLLDALDYIGVLIITNRDVSEDIQWWNENGCIQAFILANPLLADVLKNLYLQGPDKVRTAYRSGVVVTTQEIADPLLWTEKALELVKVKEGEIILIQHGIIYMTLPDGQDVKCGLLNVLACSDNILLNPKQNDSPPVYIVAMNRQFVPLSGRPG